MSLVKKKKKKSIMYPDVFGRGYFRSAKSAWVNRVVIESNAKGIDSDLRRRYTREVRRLMEFR